MKVERLDVVALNVKNLDEAIKLFSSLLGTTFVKTTDILAKEGVKRRVIITEHADRPSEEAPQEVAISPLGLELVETTPPTAKEEIRSVAFKVSDLEQAKAEIKKKGIRLLKEWSGGGLKAAVFNPDDLHGLRLVLFEYNAPSISGTHVIINAYLQK